MLTLVLSLKDFASNSTVGSTWVYLPKSSGRLSRLRMMRCRSFDAAMENVFESWNMGSSLELDEEEEDLDDDELLDELDEDDDDGGRLGSSAQMARQYLLFSHRTCQTPVERANQIGRAHLVHRCE